MVEGLDLKHILSCGLDNFDNFDRVTELNVHRREWSHLFVLTWLEHEVHYFFGGLFCLLFVRNEPSECDVLAAIHHNEVFAENLGVDSVGFDVLELYKLVDHVLVLEVVMKGLWYSEAAYLRALIFPSAVLCHEVASWSRVQITTFGHRFFKVVFSSRASFGGPVQGLEFRV